MMGLNQTPCQMDTPVDRTRMSDNILHRQQVDLGYRTLFCAARFVLGPHFSVPLKSGSIYYLTPDGNCLRRPTSVGSRSANRRQLIVPQQVRRSSSFLRREPRDLEYDTIR